MKRNKILAAALALVLVLALSVGTTLAYFTSNDQVINTFSTKDPVDPENPDETPVDITIDEPGWTKGDDGKMTKDDGSSQNIYPKQTIDKAPVVKNVGAYDAYIRASITNDATTKDAEGNDINIFAINGLTNLKANTFAELESLAAANQNSWVEYAGYYYWTSKVDSATDTGALFASVTVNEAMVTFAKDVDITVDSEAVQADGFATVGAAFAAAYSVA